MSQDKDATHDTPRPLCNTKAYVTACLTCLSCCTNVFIRTCCKGSSGFFLQGFTFYISCFLSLSFGLSSLYHLFSLLYFKARPAGFGCFPSCPWEAWLHTLCLLLSLGLSAGREWGDSNLKGRTPDGRRHPRHALFDRDWLRGSLEQPQLSVMGTEGVRRFSLLCYCDSYTLSVQHIALSMA